MERRHRMRDFGAVGIVLLLLAALVIGCAGSGKKTIMEETRQDSRPYVTLVTNMGKMTLELWPDVAPAHADSFLARVSDGFYENTIFHRVIDHFMIQGGGYSVGGAPKNVDYTLNAEFSDKPHVKGTLSAARTPDPNSASTQFFICLDRNASTASLDRQYTVFGQLVEGMDVLSAIGKVPCVPQGREMSRPRDEVVLERAYVSDATGNPL